MRYDNTSVRRQDRLLDEVRALQILHEGEYGFLALVETRADAVAGYGIPISYVFEPSTDRIYLHCGPEGHKLRCLDLRPLVTFTVVGHTRVVPAGFTTAYESVLLRGRAQRQGRRTEVRRKVLPPHRDHPYRHRLRLGQAESDPSHRRHPRLTPLLGLSKPRLHPESRLFLFSIG